MKRILTYTLSLILLTATGLGVLSHAGEIPQGQSGGSYDSQPAQTQYNNKQDTKAMEKDFQSVVSISPGIWKGHPVR